MRLDPPTRDRRILTLIEVTADVGHRSMCISLWPIKYIIMELTHIIRLPDPLLRILHILIIRVLHASFSSSFWSLFNFIKLPLSSHLLNRRIAIYSTVLRKSCSLRLGKLLSLTSMMLYYLLPLLLPMMILLHRLQRRIIVISPITRKRLIDILPMPHLMIPLFSTFLLLKVLNKSGKV